MTELLAALLARTRPTRIGPWREPVVAVPIADAAAAGRLAREAASPFGYRRPARELLARFGGGADAAPRAAAALELAGVVAEPPFDAVAPHRLVLLRRVAGPRPPAPVTVPPPRRVLAGAAGLVAIIAVIVVAMLLRAVADDGGDPRSGVVASPHRVATTPSRTHRVAVRIEPSTPSYVCVADGATLFEGMRGAPYTIRRATPRRVRALPVGTLVCGG